MLSLPRETGTAVDSAQVRHEAALPGPEDRIPRGPGRRNTDFQYAQRVGGPDDASNSSEGPASRERRASRNVVLFKAALLVLAIGIFTALALLLPTPSVGQLRSMIEQAGWWGPVGFGLGYAALTLAPVPKNVLSIAAGVLFGFGPGLLIVYIAALFGAAGAFWLGRFLGRAAVERFTGTRVARVDDVLRGHGFLTVTGVRLIPVLPFTAINYSAGLTSVGWWPFATGTALGMIPGTASFVALGAYGFEPGFRAEAALAVLGVLTIGAAVFALHTRKQSGRDHV
jgi:uncharacterized membrane protein YdjX (TVP38/TMEM64 family)